MSLLGMIVLSLVMVAIPAGAFLVVHTSPRFRVRSYVAATGTVVAADVRLEQEHYRGPTQFVPAVTYKYTVKGREYHGNRVQLRGPYYAELKDAQEYADRCMKMGSVQVWYDPLDPSYSVLLTADAPDADTARAIPLILAVGAASGLSVGWMRYVRRR
jgi:hypothetical protein